MLPGAMVDPKVFLCPSAAEVSTWMDHLESTPRTVSPALGPLAYLVSLTICWLLVHTVYTLHATQRNTLRRPGTLKDSYYTTGCERD